MNETSMLDLKKSLPMYLYEPTPADKPSSSANTDVARFLTAVRRGRWFIAATTIVFLALAVAYLLVETPLYEADTQIIIDTATSKLMQNQDSQGTQVDDTIDTNLVDSEVEVLTSDGFATRVIRALDLSHDPEFVGTPNRLVPWLMNEAAGAVTKLAGYFGAKGSQLDDPEQRALVVFSKRLVVKRKALTYVINVSFSSDDRLKSSKIANAVANIYLQTVLEAKYAAARHTGEWLQTRLNDMRMQAAADDSAVQRFKAENNIVETNRGLMDEQRLADLNSQLVLAKAATAEAKAKWETAQSIIANPDGASTVSDALTNPVIARLRAQYLDLANRAGDLSARYGAEHTTVVAIKRQMAEIKASMQNELKRIADSYQGDYTTALAREKSLTTSLQDLANDSGSSNMAQVKLKDLESSADNSRALLNGYLQKVQEANQLQTFPISDARVVTEAVSPLKPNNPKAWLVLLIGVVGGIGVGVGSTGVREMMTSTLRTGDEVEAHTGLKFLGAFPRVTPKRQKRRARTAASEEAGIRYLNPVDAYVVEAPFSRFAETARSIKVAIDGLAASGTGGKVIGVVSAAPNEGKTTIASNLAATIAMNGSRTLLIDCDLRTRALSSRLADHAQLGLLEVIADPDQLQAALVRDERTGVCMLPFAQRQKAVSSADILASEAMGEILARARSMFEYVILDVAPAVPVVDARAIAKYVDGFVMVIRWADTNRRMVQEAVEMDGLDTRMIGATLSQVDPRALREIEAYRGRDASKYYYDGEGRA
jgi:polysaccharide biosynthesis transport protein